MIRNVLIVSEAKIEGAYDKSVSVSFTELKFEEVLLVVPVELGGQDLNSVL